MVPVTLLLGLTTIRIAIGVDSTDISRLRLYLLNGYDKNARPVQNHNNATTVTIYPYMRGFEFDEVRSVLTAHFWTIMWWTDEHFKWNPKDYGNLSLLHFANHEIWQPDLVADSNFVSSEVDHFGNTRVLCKSNGRLKWVPPSRYQVVCVENLRKWPYDTQTCVVNIGSWIHYSDELDLNIPVNMTKFPAYEVVENREFKLVSRKIELRRTFEGTIFYPEVVLTMEIRRRSSLHVCAFGMPALAITSGILISFWLQPGSSERLAITLVVIFINAIYLYEIYGKVLTHGDTVSLIVIFYQDSLIMVSIALVWTICLRYLAVKKRTSRVALPRIIETFITSLPAKALCLDPRPTLRVLPPSENVDEGPVVGDENSYKDDWAWLAHLLDRFAFLVYLVIYIIFYVALV